jgi:hypothetical protein
MVVRPQNAHNDEAKGIDRKQGDELLKGRCVVRESKIAWNANFKNYDGDGNCEDTVRKTLDPTVVRTEFERDARTRFPISVHFTISVSGLPFSIT